MTTLIPPGVLAYAFGPPPSEPTVATPASVSYNPGYDLDGATLLAPWYSFTSDADGFVRLDHLLTTLPDGTPAAGDPNYVAAFVFADESVRQWTLDDASILVQVEADVPVQFCVYAAIYNEPASDPFDPVNVTLRVSELELYDPDAWTANEVTVDRWPGLTSATRYRTQGTTLDTTALRTNGALLSCSVYNYDRLDDAQGMLARTMAWARTRLTGSNASNAKVDFTNPPPIVPNSDSNGSSFEVGWSASRQTSGTPPLGEAASHRFAAVGLNLSYAAAVLPAPPEPPPAGPDFKQIYPAGSSGPVTRITALAVAPDQRVDQPSAVQGATRWIGAVPLPREDDPDGWGFRASRVTANLATWRGGPAGPESLQSLPHAFALPDYVSGVADFFEVPDEALEAAYATDDATATSGASLWFHAAHTQSLSSTSPLNPAVSGESEHRFSPTLIFRITYGQPYYDVPVPALVAVPEPEISYTPDPTRRIFW